MRIFRLSVALAVLAAAIQIPTHIVAYDDGVNEIASPTIVRVDR